MPIDLTIDTCVLMHASDKRQPHQEAASQLINRILNSDIIICVDEGFVLEFSLNKSHIGAEYLEHLRFGTLGYILVATLAAKRRVKELPRRTKDNRDKIIRQLVFDSTDRKFLAVACNSSSHILYSHDGGFVNTPTRHGAATRLSVKILTAGEEE